MDLSDLEIINLRGQALALNRSKVVQALKDDGFLLLKGATDLTIVECIEKVEKGIVLNKISILTISGDYYS